jgi:DNA (cytosine-5)-methyltransferase 1
MTSFTFLEFFAGGGMARAGLGNDWRCLFANDFDEKKVAAYRANWGADPITHCDVASLAPSDLPAEAADLVWASFPCQDLSLAGSGRGLGRDDGDSRTRSGAFWPFWNLARRLVEQGRAPRTIVLENVPGCLTSHGGRDFAAIASALSCSGYVFGAVVIDASHFVPQSRPRVFFIAAHGDLAIPDSLVGAKPQEPWHPRALVHAHDGMDARAKRHWVWWSLAQAPTRNTTFADLIEDAPAGVAWRTPAQTNYLLELMSPLNRRKVEEAMKSGRRAVGAVYRRTRPDERGVSRQRAEVRFDDVAGCLRTPAGGSSRQTILVVAGRSVRSRLLSPREAARLMGLGDDYVLPERYNDAYHVCGDGVCAPVVRHIAASILEPILNESRAAETIAAE